VVEDPHRNQLSEIQLSMQGSQPSQVILTHWLDGEEQSKQAQLVGRMHTRVYSLNHDRGDTQLVINDKDHT